MALCVLGPRSELRMRCRKIIEREDVETLLMVAVIISSLLLILDNPRLEEGSLLSVLIYVANLCFTALFTWEASLKIIAYGQTTLPQPRHGHGHAHTHRVLRSRACLPNSNVVRRHARIRMHTHTRCVCVTTLCDCA